MVTEKNAAGGLSLAVVILTYNEEAHLARALASVRNVADEIIIIDSGSTDETIAIAESAGARVYYHKFLNQADQLQWGLDNIDIKEDWIFRLDADEIIEDDLSKQLYHVLPRLDTEITGIVLNRKHIFMGKWIKHGGRYPVPMLRIWRRGAARVEQRWMDEHIVVRYGKHITISGGFSDINIRDIRYFTEKHERYATREAIDVLLSDNRRTEQLSGSSRKIQFKRAIKEKIYNKMPFGMAPLLYFLFRFFVQGGFLDGREGLIYHFLQGFWYRFLVDVKIEELRRGAPASLPLPERLSRISLMSGIPLADISTMHHRRVLDGEV